MQDVGVITKSTTTSRPEHIKQELDVPTDDFTPPPRIKRTRDCVSSDEFDGDTNDSCEEEDWSLFLFMHRFQKNHEFACIMAFTFIIMLILLVGIPIYLGFRTHESAMLREEHAREIESLKMDLQNKHDQDMEPLKALLNYIQSIPEARNFNETLIVNLTMKWPRAISIPRYMEECPKGYFSVVHGLCIRDEEKHIYKLCKVAKVCGMPNANWYAYEPESHKCQWVDMDFS